MDGIDFFTLGKYRVNPRNFTIQCENQDAILLQPKPIEVLVYLVSQHPRIVSRQELTDKVWGNVCVGERALSNDIYHLRANLKGADDNEAIISTIRYKGYQLLVEPKITRKQLKASEADTSNLLTFFNQRRLQQKTMLFVPVLLMLSQVIITVVKAGRNF